MCLKRGPIAPADYEIVNSSQFVKTTEISREVQIIYSQVLQSFKSESHGSINNVINQNDAHRQYVLCKTNQSVFIYVH